MKPRFVSPAIALILALALAGCGTNVPGPIQPPSGTTVISATRGVGEPMTISVVDIGHWPGGSSPIVFDEIEPLDRPEGLRILGVRVAVRHRNPGGIGAVEGFPPTGYATSPFPGFKFTRGSEPLQVVVGVELREKGEFLIPGFVLTYRQDGQAFGVTFHQGVAMCTPGVAGDSCG